MALVVRMADERGEAKVTLGWNQRRDAGIGAERLAVGSMKMARYSWEELEEGRERMGACLTTLAVGN